MDDISLAIQKNDSFLLRKIIDSSDFTFTEYQNRQFYIKHIQSLQLETLVVLEGNEKTELKKDLIIFILNYYYHNIEPHILIYLIRKVDIMSFSTLIRCVNSIEDEAALENLFNSFNWSIKSKLDFAVYCIAVQDTKCLKIFFKFLSDGDKENIVKKVATIGSYEVFNVIYTSLKMTKNDLTKFVINCIRFRNFELSYAILSDETLSSKIDYDMQNNCLLFECVFRGDINSLRVLVNKGLGNINDRNIGILQCAIAKKNLLALQILLSSPEIKPWDNHNQSYFLALKTGDEYRKEILFFYAKQLVKIFMSHTKIDYINLEKCFLNNQPNYLYEILINPDKSLMTKYFYSLPKIKDLDEIFEYKINISFTDVNKIYHYAIAMLGHICKSKILVSLKLMQEGIFGDSNHALSDKMVSIPVDYAESFDNIDTKKIRISVS